MRNIATVCLLVVSLASANAQRSNVLPSVKISAPPVVDGVIGEEEWKEASTFEGMVDRDAGGPVVDESRFWLAYDSQFIYFAARLTDPEPAKIQASEYRTNVATLSGNDTVMLIVDPFANNSDFNYFQMNPRGATQIMIAGGRAAKREWLGEFVSKGRITADGWEVEARIPWGVMKLPSQGKHTVIFNVQRLVARTQRALAWQYTNSGNTQNRGRWQDVEVPAAPRLPIKLLPYGYGGADGSGVIANAGIDMKTSLTDSVDVVGSINPDFRNIENNILALDFSYAERLAAESRPFFLEGSQYFNTSNDTPLFTSQRIKRFDLGAKAYGQLGPNTTIAVLDTVDFEDENSVAAKVRHQWNPRRNLNVAYAGLDRPGLRNSGEYLQYNDGVGPWFFFLQGMRTHDTTLGEGHKHNLGFSYFKDGLNAFAEYNEISPNFMPRLGFSAHRNYRGMTYSITNSRNHTGGRWLDTGYGMTAVDQTTSGGDVFNRGFFAWARTTTRRERLAFSGSLDVREFQGNHDRIATVSLGIPRGDPYRNFAFSRSSGRISGSDYGLTAVSANFRPSRMLQLTFTGRMLEALGSKREQYILSASYDLGNDSSISGRAVRSGSDVNAYLAWRRSGAAGAEYFVIAGDPNSARFRSSFVVKVVWPFEIKR